MPRGSRVHVLLDRSRRGEGNVSYPQAPAELGRSLKREAEPLVLVAFGDRILGLTAEEFVRALERGREFMACGPEQTSEPLVNVDEASRATGWPKQRLWQMAREGTIPHHRAGRSVRFALSELKEATRKEVDGEPGQPPKKAHGHAKRAGASRAMTNREARNRALAEERLLRADNGRVKAGRHLEAVK